MLDDKAVQSIPAVEDGTLESVVVELALSGKLDHVGLEAVENHRRLGLPLTMRRGDLIVRIHPDGHEDIIRRLPRLDYVLPANVRILDRA